jgi:hypothetical protein
VVKLFSIWWVILVSGDVVAVITESSLGDMSTALVVYHMPS